MYKNDQPLNFLCIYSCLFLSNRPHSRNYIQHLDGNFGVLTDTLRVLHLADNSISDINHNDHHNNISAALSSTEHIRPQQQHPKDFSNLRKLVWLDLSSNRIHHIGANALPKSIVTLDLSKNLLSSLPISIQTHLCDLRILYMRDNLLSSLDNISFKGLRSHLEKVDLSQNHIFSIPQNLFNQSTHVKALNFDRNYLTHLPSHAFTNTNILHLILSNNYISEINSNAFATLENSLEYLDFERNFLTAVPYAIMTLMNIRYLYFTSNQISSIEFLPSTLRVVSLSSNNFSRIPKEILANCSELTYLNMGYNQITFIEPSTFYKWGENLQTLLLRNNKIGNITYGAFAGLSSLKEISLSFNDIHYVHPLAFEDIAKTLKILELSFSILNDDLQIDMSTLNELMWLGLDNNNLKTLSNDSLSTLYELTYINLSFNRLETIPIDLFIGGTHRNLEEIDLSYNVIGRMRAYTFSSLQSLQTINLSSNKIKCLERSSFYNLPHLAHIDLSHNQLRSISEGSFELLPNLLRIDMMFNSLVTFSLKCFQHVSNASTPMSINISNNALNNFDSELSTYLYIYSLDLSNNHLSDAKAFRNIGYSLRVLYLNGNNISVLGNHALGDFPVLEVLNMAHNRISTMRRQSFQGLMNLQELDLGHNQIETIQIEQFSNLLQLRYLRLDNNQIKALPRELFLNTRIEFLDLSNNFLTVWPVNSFSDVGFTLRTVHMNHNLLEYLDSTMFMNTLYLSELHLSENQIKILPDNTFSTLHNLTSLDLSYNPLITTNFKELFLNTRQLRFLNLKSTGLFKVPTMYLDKLMELDLSKNGISEIDLQLYKLKHLRKLIISENQIYNLTSFLKRLPPYLRHLDISRNPIRKQVDFTPIKRLEVLAMEDVKISNINAFATLQNLRILRMNLEHNINELISQLHGLCELYLTVHEHRLEGRYFGKLLPNTKLNYIEITGHKLKSIAPNAFNGLVRNVNLKISIRKTMISNLPANLFYGLRLIPKLTIQLIGKKKIDLFQQSSCVLKNIFSHSLPLYY